ncbi:MAG: hypothetical protein IJ447_03005 [Clostridia bacterium]|nr:hypothetical protein [Clostridia bacterium]
MKKIISLVISVVLVMLTVVTSSAASLAKFNITLVSETDKQAVVTIDFNGGTGFSGFDFDVQLDSKRVEVVSAENGKGFLNFQKQASAAFALINPDSTPVKGTMVAMPAYRNVEDSKDLFVITLKKLSKEPLTNDDFKIVITNCVDSNYNIIETSLTTDLQGVGADDTTSSAVAPSTTPDEVSSTSVYPTEEPEFTNAIEGTSGEVIDAENGTTDEMVQNENGGEKDDSNSKGIIIAVVAVVFVAAVAVVAVIVMKKKKSPEDINDKSEG